MTSFSSNELLVRSVIEDLYIFRLILKYISKEGEIIKLHQLTRITYNNLQYYQMTGVISTSILKKANVIHQKIFKNIESNCGEIPPCIDPTVLHVKYSEKTELNNITKMVNMRMLVLSSKIKIPNVTIKYYPSSLSTLKLYKIIEPVTIELPVKLKVLYVNRCKNVTFAGIFSRSMHKISLTNTECVFNNVDFPETNQSECSFVTIVDVTIYGTTLDKILSTINHNIWSINIYIRTVKIVCPENGPYFGRYKLQYTHPNYCPIKTKYVLIIGDNSFGYSTGIYVQNLPEERHIALNSNNELEYPKDVMTLDVYENFEFEHLSITEYPFLRSLSIRSNITKRIMHWHSGLKHILLDGSYNFPIETLPHSLMELFLPRDYDHCLPALPDSLCALYLGKLYNHPLPTLPKSLCKLYLGDKYNHPLPKLPDSLKILSIGTEFNQEMNEFFALEKIYMSTHNTKRFTYKIPDNIQVIVF